MLGVPANGYGGRCAQKADGRPSPRMTQTGGKRMQSNASRCYDESIETAHLFVLVGVGLANRDEFGAVSLLADPLNQV